MKTTISKWGNSAAIRLPSKVLEESGLKAGDEVEIKAYDDRVILDKVKKRLTLNELVDKITPENMHGDAWG